MSTDDPVVVPRQYERNYEYHYGCKNWLVVPAVELSRKIQFYDHYCPVCILPDPVTYVEASFPYNYEQIECDEHPHVEMRTMSVEGHVNVEMTGTYVYTYHVEDTFGNTNDGDCIGARQYTHTVIVEDHLEPVISL